MFVGIERPEQLLPSLFQEGKSSSITFHLQMRLVWGSDSSGGGLCGETYMEDDTDHYPDDSRNSSSHDGALFPFPGCAK